MPRPSLRNDLKYAIKIEVVEKDRQEMELGFLYVRWPRQTKLISTQGV